MWLLVLVAYLAKATERKLARSCWPALPELVAVVLFRFDGNVDNLQGIPLLQRNTGPDVDLDNM